MDPANHTSADSRTAPREQSGAAARGALAAQSGNADAVASPQCAACVRLKTSHAVPHSGAIDVFGHRRLCIVPPAGYRRENGRHVFFHRYQCSDCMARWTKVVRRDDSTGTWVPGWSQSDGPPSDPRDPAGAARDGE